MNTENNSSNKKIKILIADDYLLLRTAWQLLLKSNPDFEVVGTTADGKEAVEFIKNHKVDIVLMDINMPNLNGIEATIEIDNIAPWVKIIGLSMHSEAHYISKMLKSGARGFVTKSADKEELFKAIHDVHNNINYISPSIAHKILGNLDDNNGKKGERKTELSGREIDIIRYIIDGKTSKQIGEELCISFKTVEAHKSNIFKKLSVNNVAAMTKKVIEQGILIM